MRERVRHRWCQLALALLAVAAIWSVAIACERRVAWLLVVPVILSLITGVRRAPVRFAALVRRIGYGVIALTVLYGFLWTSSLVYAGPIVSLGPATAVCALVLGVVFILGTRVWNPASAALPVLLAAILSASFIAAESLQAPFALAGLALFLYGAVTLEPLVHHVHQTRAAIGQALFVLMVAGLAAGTAYLLPQAQPYVENMVFSRMSSGASTGFSVDGSLGSVASLSRSSRLVARVFTDKPQHLRLYVATRFDGRAWSREPGTAVQLQEAHSVPVSGRFVSDWISGRWYRPSGTIPDQRWTATRVITEFTFDDRLLTPAGLWFVRSPRDSRQLDGGGVLRGATPRMFGTLSGPIQPSFSDVNVEDCLAIPPDVDPRIVELANSLARGSESTTARVAETLRFLGREFRYSLDVGNLRTADPLSEFLFEKKVGYCEYFATAAAILLRLQDVPTRYVRGFIVSEWNRRGRHFVMRESNAHAWIEVWDPTSGWIEVDPTPADQYAGVHAERASWLKLAWERLTGEWVAFFARLKSGNSRARARLILRILVIPVVSIAIILLARRTPFRRSRSAKAPPIRCRPEMERLIVLFDRKLRKSGWPRPASRAPLEHLNDLPQNVLAPEWRDGAREVIHHIYAEIYGGRAVGADRIARLERLINRSI